jgi:hypothetical protein
MMLVRTSASPRSRMRRATAPCPYRRANDR